MGGPCKSHDVEKGRQALLQCLQGAWHAGWKWLQGKQKPQETMRTAYAADDFAYMFPGQNGQRLRAVGKDTKKKKYSLYVCHTDVLFVLSFRKESHHAAVNLEEANRNPADQIGTDLQSC